MSYRLPNTHGPGGAGWYKFKVKPLLLWLALDRAAIHIDRFLTPVGMKLNAIGCVLWAVLVDFSVVTPRTLESNDSCPCVSSAECSEKSRLFFNNVQVLILPCEDKNLVRCCSTVARSIEAAHTNGSLWESKNEVDSKISSTQEIVEEPTSMMQISVPSLEESAWDVPVNESEGLDDASTVESKNVTRTDPAEDSAEVTQKLRSDAIVKNVNQVPLQHPRKEFLSEPRLIHGKILSNTVTSASSISNFRASGSAVRGNLEPKRTGQTVPVSLAHDEDDSYVLDLIYKVKNFESRRTVPKQPDLLLDSVGEARLAPPDAVVLNNGYFNMKLRVLPAARRLSEKMSDPLEQKTSLEKALTLDRVSAQATNENASPLSELDVAERDDTSNGNLSHPEDVEDVKRVARSHASEPNEETPGFSSPVSEAASQTEAEAAPTKRFRRPPRVLPFRNLHNEEHGSGKFANSQERARSLFDKSNEMRRKQVSLLINRNDSSPKKSGSMKANYSSTERTGNEGSSSESSVDLSTEESELVDEDR
ncbi:uncharacterized protein LOC116432206 isoform X1 [Nomia melanderi]|uniref:uncharacterized protein LOC116432206 isoform X1 n=2 Tax=Nomia melanderi TaxID=2448451 RepID=UPI003FCE0D9A